MDVPASDEAAAADVSGAVPAGGRKLARIVRIDAIRAIEKAERVQCAEVCGWTVVCKLNEFAPGDLAIYYEIGAIPSLTYAHTAFLGGKPIKTKKMFGVLSQGLLGPLSWLPEDVRARVELDMDVTDVLGVTKWVDADEMQQYVADSSRAPWPGVVPKTDEERIQNMRDPRGTFGDRPLVLTQKYDGTSCTFLSLGGQVSVCGRNCKLACRCHCCCYCHCCFCCFCCCCHLAHRLLPWLPQIVCCSPRAPRNITLTSLNATGSHKRWRARAIWHCKARSSAPKSMPIVTSALMWISTYSMRMTSRNGVM